MKKTIITTAIAAAVLLATGSASATWRPPFFAAQTVKACVEGGTASYSAYQWYCISGDGKRRATLVLDPTYAPDTNRSGVTQIFNYPGGPHPLTDAFQRDVVEPACRDFTSSVHVRITGRDELVPNYGDRFE